MSILPATCLPQVPSQRLRAVAEAAEKTGRAELWIREDCFWAARSAAPGPCSPGPSVCRRRSGAAVPAARRHPHRNGGRGDAAATTTPARTPRTRWNSSGSPRRRCSRFSDERACANGSWSNQHAILLRDGKAYGENRRRGA